jgi:PHD/YefM family antitoxin component YafN of YafNO toxin-antitoxin module
VAEPNHDTMAQRVPTAVARKQFARMVDKGSRGQRIKLTRYNKTQAVIISKEDLSRLEECERATPPGTRRR